MSNNFLTQTFLEVQGSLNFAQVAFIIFSVLLMRWPMFNCYCGSGPFWETD